MAQFPTPSQIETQYFKILKSIKPSLNVNDPNSDFTIRGKAYSGLVSGIYGDQAKVDNDTFIGSSRPEALDLKGADLALPRQPATQAESPQITLNGTNGTIVTPGELTFIYSPTGVLYTNTTGGTIALGVLDVQVLAQTSGQIGNVQAPDTLTVVSPPPGVGASAAVTQSLADGSDVESDDSYRSRLLIRMQEPPAGGNVTDYPAFAFAADPSVRSVLVKRFGRGLGTVDVYITTGTTDIEAAVTQGLPIVRIPGAPVIATVQAYYDTHAPLTDCPEVFAPTEVMVDATIHVELAAGILLTTVPADPINNPLNLTVAQLIVRDAGRAMYEQPVGGKIIPGFTTGFMTAADIETSLDIWLSATKDIITGAFKGKIPVLLNRQCDKLDSPNYDQALAPNELATPGTITVVLGV